MKTGHVETGIYRRNWRRPETAAEGRRMLAEWSKRGKDPLAALRLDAEQLLRDASTTRERLEKIPAAKRDKAWKWWRRDCVLARLAALNLLEQLKRGNLPQVANYAFHLGQSVERLKVISFEPVAQTGDRVCRGNAKRRAAGKIKTAGRVAVRREAVRRAYREKRAKLVRPSAAVAQIVRAGPLKIGLPATVRLAERTVWRDVRGLK